MSLERAATDSFLPLTDTTRLGGCAQNSFGRRCVVAVVGMWLKGAEAILEFYLIANERDHPRFLGPPFVLGERRHENSAGPFEAVFREILDVAFAICRRSKLRLLGPAR